jgi:serine/threonine protein kinase
LFEYLSELQGFSETAARGFFKQLISALKELHDRGIAHRDLKPENLLLDSTLKLKLADFGFSTCHNVALTPKGTLGYAAPEILLHRSYCPRAVDVFSLGVILFGLLAGHSPFQFANQKDKLFASIMANRVDYFWKQHCSCKPKGYFSSKFMSLVSTLLQPDPPVRMTLDEIQAHPWMQAEAASDLELESQIFKSKLMGEPIWRILDEERIPECEFKYRKEEPVRGEEETVQHTI